jgi:hypothetical protein
VSASDCGCPRVCTSHGRSSCCCVCVEPPLPPLTSAASMALAPVLCKHARAYMPPHCCSGVSFPAACTCGPWLILCFACLRVISTLLGPAAIIWARTAPQCGAGQAPAHACCWRPLCELCLGFLGTFPHSSLTVRPPQSLMHAFADSTRHPQRWLLVWSGVGSMECSPAQFGAVGTAFLFLRRGCVLLGLPGSGHPQRWRKYPVIDGQWCGFRSTSACRVTASPCVV